MTKYLEKLNHLDRQLNSPMVHQQVEEVNQIIVTVSAKKILAQAPQKLGLEPDEFENILDSVGEVKREQLTVINHLLNGLRQYLSLQYGIWSLPNLKTAHLIKEKLHAKTALEIMAGNAYWSKALNSVGVKTTATDNLEWAKTSNTGSQIFEKVEDLDAVRAIKKYPKTDVIICSWSPNFGQSDLAVVKTWKNCSDAHLLFIGEKDGATNSPEFWQKMNFINDQNLKTINRSFVSYDFIDEKIYEIKRRPIVKLS